MNLVDRVKNICLTPATEWQVIAGEQASAGTLIPGYVVPLAGISAVAGLIGGSLVGTTLPFVGTFRVPIAMGLAAAVVTFVMAIVSVFIISLIINALAPTFGAEKNSEQALKVAVYSFTPAWVAGVLQILPMLGILVLLASLYSLYILYLGLPRLMKCPPEKAIGYTAVVVICAIVLSVVVASVTGMITAAGMAGAGGLGGVVGAGGDVQFDPNSPAGRLQEFGRQMEQAGRQVEQAEQSGDPNAQAAAAMNALGALLGGGARVEPLAIDQLQPFVPERFAGLARTSSNAERTGLAGIMVSSAKATYGDGAQKTVTLEVQDTGGVSGIVGLASWVGVEEQKEDDFASERTQRVGGRMVHEKRSKTGGTNEYGIVLGERFVVSASGTGVTLDELKAAVSGLNLAGLEAMKGAGTAQ
jgi:hypothetical protein